MRYEARHRNGAWQLFDFHQYAAIDAFDRQVDAEGAAAWMNGQDALRRASRC